MSKNRTTQLSRYRGGQTAATSGPGFHFVSPQKCAPKRKTEQKATSFLDLETKRCRLQKELEELLSSTTPNTAASSSDGLAASNDMDVDPDDQWVNETPDHDVNDIPSQLPDNSTPVKIPSKKKQARVQFLVPDDPEDAPYCASQDGSAQYSGSDDDAPLARSLHRLRRKASTTQSKKGRKTRGMSSMQFSVLPF